MDISFHGAAGEVTGSCLLVTVGGKQLLLDCGLIQGSAAEEARNRRAFPFNPQAIDAVVLSHAHLDHSGRLPLLVKGGFRGPIYTHRATRDLSRIMLLDAAALAERDAVIETRKRQRQARTAVEPLYTRAEAEAAVRQFRALDYDSEQDILPGVRLRLRDAGHILGSAIVELWLTEGTTTRKLVFSGDLGHRGAPILRNPATVREADLVILESTYGDRNHRSWDATWQELGEVFRAAAHHAGNILIPAFAIGRTQELLYVFKQHWREWGLDRWTVFLDSPMAIAATEVYARHANLFNDKDKNRRRRNGDLFAPPNLHFSRTSSQSMAINRIQSGAVIIAGSGMCNGGAHPPPSQAQRLARTMPRDLHRLPGAWHARAPTGGWRATRAALGRKHPRGGATAHHRRVVGACRPGRVAGVVPRFRPAAAAGGAGARRTDRDRQLGRAPPVAACAGYCADPG